jgi:hypothetical protein
MANTSKPLTRERLQAAIDALLARWQAEGANDAPGAIAPGGDERAIDDGSGYGDPLRGREHPEWLAGDYDGWVLVQRLGR